MSRGITLDATLQLVTEECCNCGVLFAMPQEVKDRRVDDHGSFYCPNGHGQHYTGKTEAEKLRETLELRSRQLANAHEDARVERSRAVTQRNRANGYKGQLARTKKRVAAGVCPCCSRSFKNVASHMRTQHPDYAGIA